MSQRVDEFLKASTKARVLSGIELGLGRQLAIWQNRDDFTAYDDTRGHTFSLYLRGGQGTTRVDKAPQSGRPGAICVFPEGHSSHWKITDPFRFMHLYVPDDVLRASFARTHDRDARDLDLREWTFDAPEAFLTPMAALAQAVEAQDVLAADTAFAELVAILPERRASVQGGLTRRVLSRVDDWIEAHLDGPIRLVDLAALADLSEFHFHRMFRQTRGMAPQKWVLQTRIARAKRLLKTMTPAEVATACGFASQSHLTRHFKVQTGMTPGAYRKAVAARSPY